VLDRFPDRSAVLIGKSLVFALFAALAGAGTSPALGLPIPRHV